LPSPTTTTHTQAHLQLQAARKAVRVDPGGHQVLLQRAQMGRRVLAGSLLRLAQPLLQLGVLVADLGRGVVGRR
jgi:hypothetical protein